MVCKQGTSQDMFCYSEHGSVNIQLEEDTCQRRKRGSTGNTKEVEDNEGFKDQEEEMVHMICLYSSFETFYVKRDS